MEGKPFTTPGYTETLTGGLTEERYVDLLELSM